MEGILHIFIVYSHICITLLKHFFVKRCQSYGTCFTIRFAGCHSLNYDQHMKVLRIPFWNNCTFSITLNLFLSAFEAFAKYYCPTSGDFSAAGYCKRFKCVFHNAAGQRQQSLIFVPIAYSVLLYGIHF